MPEVATEALAPVAGTQNTFVVAGALGLVTVIAFPFVHRLPEPTEQKIDA